ncbi:MAG: hypothetical protein H7Y42_10080 [Chitinophagaceae bacterium]|nr:hypothetical protein [Chitinophagaceae bacterium]
MMKVNAVENAFHPGDSMPTSTAQEAIDYLNGINTLDASSYWPNVDPVLFLQNLKGFTVAPLKFYEGKGTNFCAYAALTYLPLQFDPLGFSKFMVEFYRNGQARMGKVMLKPSRAVRNEAGLIKYKGALDIQPAGQMWILSLADHFKGYLNIFNRRYDKGDEDKIWASTNFAKFNRMLRKLFLLKVNARGADLIRPGVGDRYTYLKEKMKTGTVFLYLNNRLLYKKDHVTVRLGIPTHYVALFDIQMTENGKINIVYWDYGQKTLQQLQPKFFRKILFGVTHCETPVK